MTKLKREFKELEYMSNKTWSMKLDIILKHMWVTSWINISSS